MGGKTPKTPKVVTRDPVADQRAAEAEATRKTNAELADRRRRRAGSSLLTAGPRGSGPPTRSLLAQANPSTPQATPASMGPTSNGFMNLLVQGVLNKKGG